MKTTPDFRALPGKLRSSKWVNKYTLTLFVFCIWMLFFDKHNMLAQRNLSNAKQNLEEQISRDRALLEEAKEEQRKLNEELEKYAREKYLMHRQDEEVFIVVKD